MFAITQDKPGGPNTLRWEKAPDPTPGPNEVIIDIAVILPHETRLQLVRALRALRGKRASGPPKKHGNIPL